MSNDSNNRVQSILESTPVVDAHSDYAVQLFRQRQRGKTDVLRTEHLPALQQGGVNLEVLTVGGDFYLPDVDLRDTGTALRIIDAVQQDIELHPDLFTLLLDARDIESWDPHSTTAFMYALEGVRPLGDDQALLRIFHRLGVRSVILTHNERNLAADGCGESSAGGLSSFGKELVREIQTLSMILDLVHISERCFFEALDIYESSPVVSHSNARKLCDHPRNLTDEQIRAVADRNGVIGLNFLAHFIDTEKQRWTLDRLVDHAEHMADIAGIDHIGLGPDFADYYLDVLTEWLVQQSLPADMLTFVEGCAHVGDMKNVFAAFVGRGFSDEDLRKILGGNFLRVYEQVLE